MMRACSWQEGFDVFNVDRNVLVELVRFLCRLVVFPPCVFSIRLRLYRRWFAVVLALALAASCLSCSLASTRQKKIS